MYKFLLLDLDDTILDFHKAEYFALRQTLERFGLNPSDEVCARYSVINQAHWEALERKEMTREQVLVGRYEVLFSEYGITADAAACAAYYADALSQNHYFLPGAEETLKHLAPRYRMYLVSNGTAAVQHGRLKSANIGQYFEAIFISQEVGVNKPDKLFFDRCFEKIPGFDPAKAIIIGDSLTSDILGGKNAGIATCWVNLRHKPVRPDIVPDYEIESITQLPALLESLQ